MDMSSHHTLDRPTITTDADGITVRVCWKPADDLDRLDAAAWGLKSSHRKLAERLVRAIEAGVVLEPDGLYTDATERGKSPDRPHTKTAARLDELSGGGSVCGLLSGVSLSGRGPGSCYRSPPRRSRTSGVSRWRT
jgi:hypothetical protein